MRAAAPDVILVAKSNAGMPELVEMRAVYRADPTTMAGQVLEMHGAGARIVGGCCGSTPEHLAAIRRALASALTTPSGAGSASGDRRQVGPAGRRVRRVRSAKGLPDLGHQGEVARQLPGRGIPRLGQVDGDGPGDPARPR